MKVVHYIPTIDRNFGGTTFYMQLLGNELGKLVELHIITHSSNHPVEIKNSIVHTIAEFKYYRIMKRQFKTLLQTINPDVYHVNGCWTPGCAFTQKWAQEMGYKVIITPHGMLEPWILARHYWTRKIPALLLYQKSAIRKSNYLHATAESEKEKSHSNEDAARRTDLVRQCLLSQLHPIGRSIQRSTTKQNDKSRTSTNQ